MASPSECIDFPFVHPICCVTNSILFRFPFSVGAHSAQNKSENANKTGNTRSALGNQVIRKGHMCIQNLGIMKGKHQTRPPTHERACSLCSPSPHRSPVRLRMLIEMLTVRLRATLL